MKAFLSAGPALLAAMVVFCNSARAQGLQLSSIDIATQGVVRLSLNNRPTASVHVQASSDLKAWTEITNKAADANGVVSFSRAAANGAVEFFRIFTASGGTGNSNRFVATITALYGGPITNATVSIVGTNLTFTTDASGQVSIPVADLAFDTGFTLRVNAPGYVADTTDLPPGLYAYTFTLTPIEFAPATIDSRTYRLGASNLVTLYDSGLFQLQTSNQVSAGSYSADRSTIVDDTWSIKAAGATGYGEIGLTFYSATAGRFTNLIDGVVSAGDFTEIPFTNAPPIQPPSSPAAIKTIRFVTLDSPLGPGLDFTFDLTGASTGTFLVSGAFEGEGTFTYTRGASATELRLDYTDQFNGDFDDFTLKFIEGGGLNTNINTFSGTMSAEGNVGPVTGTFTYETTVP
jgi:hypothetical protein